MSEWLHLGLHTLRVFFSGISQEGRMLQICQPASFVSNFLSIPFPQDGRQVLLHCHLLSVAAVAVCEDPVWVSLGQGLWAVLQCSPPAARDKREVFQHHTHTHTHSHKHTCVCTFTMWPLLVGLRSLDAGIRILKGGVGIMRSWDLACRSDVSANPFSFILASHPPFV